MQLPRALSAADLRAYGYVPRSETAPYFAMATQYAFADRMFQTNEGPSFPAHLYLIAGSSATAFNSMLRIAENPSTPHHGTTAGCDSPPGTRVKLIDAAGNENRTMYPCLERQTIFDSLQEKHLTWRYYQAHRRGSGLWNAVDAIHHLRNGPAYATSVVYPPSKFLTDVAKGRLANLSVITPTADNSDHAGITDLTGFVGFTVVNAIGTSGYWRSTAIFVTWDDWGGWYDHVRAVDYNSYALASACR